MFLINPRSKTKRKHGRNDFTNLGRNDFTKFGRNDCGRNVLTWTYRML